MTIQPTPPVVLTLAGSDPSGGAGIQADILTLASLGCHPLSVITAITVQDTVGINDFMVLDADWVNDQARFLMEDIPVTAFKIGMLGSVENVAVVAQLIADYPDIPVVLDPVLASGGGHELADEDLIAAMRDMLIPQVSILTPNSIEARRIASNDADEDEDLTLEQCAQRILALGRLHLLITGTHENTKEVVNQLYGPGGLVRPMPGSACPAVITAPAARWPRRSPACWPPACCCRRRCARRRSTPINP